MKKLLAVFVSLLLSAHVFAQDIETDSMTEQQTPTEKVVTKKEKL